MLMLGGPADGGPSELLSPADRNDNVSVAIDDESFTDPSYRTAMDPWSCSSSYPFSGIVSSGNSGDAAVGVLSTKATVGGCSPCFGIVILA